MSKTLILDNYDSFTYNLFHYLDASGEHQIDVIRNDKIQLKEIAKYDKIVLSPGPGLPKDAGKMMGIIEEYHSTKNILGVCLGHQAIVEFLGGRLKNLQTVVHGQTRKIEIVDEKDILFEGLPRNFKVGRYHSWVIDRNYLPEGIKVSSVDEDGEVMSYYHERYKLNGVQFHPESILSSYGMEMIGNWLEIPS